MHPVSLFLSGRRFVVDWTWHPGACCEMIFRGRKRVAESRRALHASCPKVDPRLHEVVQAESRLLMSVTFSEAVHQLAQLAGVDIPRAFEDEHVRWSVYEASVSDPARRQILKDAIRGEANGRSEFELR